MLTYMDFYDIIMFNKCKFIKQQKQQRKEPL